ncbi:MAG: GtrA family protein [Prevotella sp.]
MHLKDINTSERKAAEFIRFCINGVVAVIIQYGVYWLLLHVSEKNIAFTAAYIVSFCYNFLATSYWTFHSRPSWKRFTGFAGSHVVNYLVQILFLNIFSFSGLSAQLSGLAAMAVAVPINYALLHFVYKKYPGS